MSEKRKAEGIALLSLYNDEDMDQDDDDDDVVDVDKDDGDMENRPQHDNIGESPPPSPPPLAAPLPPFLSPFLDSRTLPQDHQGEVKEEEMEEPKGEQKEEQKGEYYKQEEEEDDDGKKEEEEEDDKEEGEEKMEGREVWLGYDRFGIPPPPPPSGEDAHRSSSPPSVPRSSRGAASYSIVDYGHDETAQSPEPEEGEVLNVGNAIFGQDLRQANNGGMLEQASTLESQSEELNQPSGIYDRGTVALQDNASYIAMEMDSVETMNAEAAEPDPLADFLPPLPKEKCSDELQNKFAKYLALKNAGRSFNEELRKSKGYRNPDFLQHAVKYQGIDQIGSCFGKEVFDPYGYDPSDFYDALALAFKRELERKEREKKHGVHAVPTTAVNTGAPSIPASVDTTGKVEGRTNKKSKWDKIDGDDGKVSIPLPSGTKDAIAAANAAAAFLTAKAGAGYASFAQQKRKEADERVRSKEKIASKSDKK